MRTSIVNSKPAMGALKMPAIPAAAPQATSMASVCGGSLNACPRLLPMAAPVNTMGPSAPTDPPKPMVNDEAMSDEYMLCIFRRLFFSARA